MTTSDPRNGSIGIFDSGFGGLTVMRAIRELMPSENMIYFGDTARLPYGSKSASTILRYSLENASFLVKGMTSRGDIAQTSNGSKNAIWLMMMMTGPAVGMFSRPVISRRSNNLIKRRKRNNKIVWLMVQPEG